jgi:hypothetical protein
MTVQRRKFLQLGWAAVALPTLQKRASAQAYPSRPITLIVPLAAGGITDVVARVVGERMRVRSINPSLSKTSAVPTAASVPAGRPARDLTATRSLSVSWDRMW